MACRLRKGVFIPDCMGCAAAMGCGLSLKDIRSYCTCEKPTRLELEERVTDLELAVTGLMKRMNDYESGDKKDQGKPAPSDTDH